ncbi:DUF2651 family protein [Bacillus sp. DNRA2]|uniref:DUF2651 family protein n=1 Tax=Bacillus sp. DNRA2 TaxID=2723053 RepID=UPI00145DF5C5|nr:DUF2651 family protein [Bacillus sp. DNRA2]NMD70964.1 DUF2651 family protein [Bacillus sp. DNRA2]
MLTNQKGCQNLQILMVFLVVHDPLCFNKDEGDYKSKGCVKVKMIKDSLLFALLMIVAMFVAVLFSGGYYHMYGENFLLQLIEYPLIIAVVSILGTIRLKKWFLMPLLTFVVVNLFFLILFSTTYFEFAFAYSGFSLIISVITYFIKRVGTD